MGLGFNRSPVSHHLASGGKIPSVKGLMMKISQAGYDYLPPTLVGDLDYFEFGVQSTGSFDGLQDGDQIAWRDADGIEPVDHIAERHAFWYYQEFVLAFLNNNPGTR